MAAQWTRDERRTGMYTHLQAMHHRHHVAVLEHELMTCTRVCDFGFRDNRPRGTDSKVDFVLYENRFHFLCERLFVQSIVIASFDLEQNLGRVLTVQGLRGNIGSDNCCQLVEP